MRGSAKGCEPEELHAWKALQIENNIEPQYRALHRPERDAMLGGLYAEQTGQCVYCGRGISLDQRESYQVEHFRPQKKYRHLQLEYTNLFLTCKSEGKGRSRQTCGAHKGKWFEEDCHIPPAPESCTERFQFRSSGDIIGDDCPKSEKMIEVLILNQPELVTQRQVLIEELDQNLYEGVPEDDLRQSYLEPNSNGARPSFAHVAVAYLKA